MPATDVFPVLRCCMKLGGEKENYHQLFDVKFNPLAIAPEPLEFAIAGGKDILVCRETGDENDPIDVVLHWEDDHASYNSLEWTRDPTTGRAWLVAAGHTPKHIVVLDPSTGLVVRRLQGHGRGVNDLAIFPLSVSLLASASEDYTVRLWDLDPRHTEQPCVAIFAGGAHNQPILCLGFHPNGRWLLTGAMDTAVALWSVPDPAELTDREPLAEPRIVHHPHFYSTEVHPNYVDNVHFYGDLIISRASKGQQDMRKAHEILIWKIDGFDSDEPPPTHPRTPKPGVFTRTSFEHERSSRGFHRLLTLDMPDTDRFYLRFGLLHEPGMRPILAMGNQQSKFLFWDLQRLVEGVDPADDRPKKRGKMKPKPKPTAGSATGLDTALEGLRAGSVDSSSAYYASSTASVAQADQQRRYTLDDPFTPVKPHHSAVARTNISAQNFATSQMAWSPDGTWLVGVGDNGMVCIFRRDASVVNAVQNG